MAAHESLNEHQTGEMVRRLNDPDQGGFTYDPRQKDFVTSGYAVAAHRSAEMKVEGGLTEAHLEGYIKGSAPTWSAGAQSPVPEGGSRKDRGKVMIGGWHNTADLPMVYPETPTGHMKSRQAQVLRGEKAGFSLHELADDPNPWSPRPPDLAEGEHKDIGRLSEQFPEFARMAEVAPHLAVKQPEISAWTEAPTRKAQWAKEAGKAGRGRRSRT